MGQISSSSAVFLICFTLSFSSVILWALTKGPSQHKLGARIVLLLGIAGLLSMQGKERKWNLWSGPHNRHIGALASPFPYYPRITSSFWNRLLASFTVWPKFRPSGSSDHCPKTMKPRCKINLFSFKLIVSGILL